MGLLGAVGVKLDFVDSDRQAAFRQTYDPCYEITARHKLLLNFHGCTVPTGERRTWPQNLTREGVRGGEYTDGKSASNLNLVYTRNVIGPMDYTPVELNLPNGGPPPTTRANQIAQAVLFESGIQHFVDTPEHYLASPAKPFLMAVPVTWDDIRLLDGYPDKFVLLARRHGADWYVGANGTEAVPAGMEVNLSFLDAGKTYQATIYKDGKTPLDIDVETRAVTAKDALHVPTLPDGGFAIQLVPAAPGN